MSSQHDHEDEQIDEAELESFPASDPPANTPETGVRIGPLPPSDEPEVSHDAAAQQFVVDSANGRAFLQYEASPQRIAILHTEVPGALAGLGVGGRLATTALDWARTQGRPLQILCPFVRDYVRKHPQLGM